MFLQKSNKTQPSASSSATGVFHYTHKNRSETVRINLDFLVADLRKAICVNEGINSGFVRYSILNSGGNLLENGASLSSVSDTINDSPLVLFRNVQETGDLRRPRTKSMLETQSPEKRSAIYKEGKNTIMLVFALESFYKLFSGFGNLFNIFSNAYDWPYLSSLFKDVIPFEENLVTIISDRSVKFKSKPLKTFFNLKQKLEFCGIPDLRFQAFNIETCIRNDIQSFLSKSEYLGLLIGPTGCGKTHELLNIANNQFTVFIDAQEYLAVNTNDLSVFALKQSFNTITNSWIKANQDIECLRTIAYAFVLSRMLFLKYLRELQPDLTASQFLIHQLFNSNSIQRCFMTLKSLSFVKNSMRSEMK